MDNLDVGKPGNPSPNKPISLGKDMDKPIPLDDVDLGKKSVSHSPLDLGGSHPVGVQKMQKPAVNTAPSVNKPVQAPQIPRITGIKNFFAKLHPGAIEFLDEQIIEWLKKNPSIIVKQTNTTVGDLQAKNTEPNLIITIWY
jgi:hypothetical protein